MSDNWIIHEVIMKEKREIGIYLENRIADQTIIVVR